MSKIDEITAISSLGVVVGLYKMTENFAHEHTPLKNAINSFN